MAERDGTVTTAAAFLHLAPAPELRERLRLGMGTGSLGQYALAAPLGLVALFGRSESPRGPRAGTVGLMAMISPGRSVGGIALAAIGRGAMSGLMEPPTTLGPDGAWSVTRHGDGIVARDHHARAIAVTHATVMNHVVVACGNWPLAVPVTGSHVPPLVWRFAEELDAAITAFTDAVAATVAALYARARVSPPHRAYTFGASAVGIDGPASVGRALGRAARAITGGFPAFPGTGRLPGDGGIARPVETARLAPVRRSTEDASDPFAAVGGLPQVKRELRGVLVAVRDPDAYRRWGVRPPRGVLLHGPPGTGKTLLARCLALGAGARFVHVRSTDVTSKWYGEAERRLQAVFDDARANPPTVIFFDELDAVAPSREDSHEATHRIVSTLLVNLDGLEDTHDVVVVAATNRPDTIDSALVRPGRFDRLIEVPLPDREGRDQILRIHVEDASRAAGREIFAPPGRKPWEALLQATEGMNGASLAEVVRRALEARVLAGDRDGQVTAEDLLRECAGVA